jgi:phage tail-like protein
MSDIVPAEPTSIKTIDSLCANEFMVELEGQPLEGVFRVSGLITFKLDTKTTNALKKVQEAFKLTKMVQRDGNNVFNRWLRETVKAKDDIVRPKRTLAVIAVDDGVETRRWTVKGAWITEVAYTDFDSGNSEMVEETITIKFDDIEETWAATPDLE